MTQTSAPPRHPFYTFALLPPAQRGEGSSGGLIADLAAKWGIDLADLDPITDLRREPDDDQVAWRA
jgi:hypothetical protein